MLNLDPALLDQDKIRLHRRKILLIISILPATILILVALFLGRTGIYNLFLSIDTGNKLYSTSKSFNGFQKVGNIIEPYLAYYNSGIFTLYDAKTEDDLVSAELEFRESLKNNPPQEMLCHIIVNLSYSIELQADLKVSNKLYDESLALYNRADGILYENNCASKESSDKKGSDKKAESAKERIADKRRKVIAAANNETDEGGENGNNQQQIDEKTLNQVREKSNSDSQNAGSYIRGMSSFKNQYSKNYDVPGI